MPPLSNPQERVLNHHIVLDPVHKFSPHALIQHGDDVLLVHMDATVQGEPISHFFVYAAATGCLLDPDACSAEQVTDEDRCLGVGKSQKARTRANLKAMDVFYKAYPGADEGSIRIDRVWRAVWRGARV